eukprot:TRINITY_DN31744_c0_g1_i1.p1 TRINITY_DN31744_c0_g1~~TRINITY_DN31744_c0_g1_i1.p1  ORF type:complete len:137 (+),score=22.07 TRINITY_DN31744_c0_g1_i1:85-495(+)
MRRRLSLGLALFLAAHVRSVIGDDNVTTATTTGSAPTQAPTPRPTPRPPQLPPTTTTTTDYLDNYIMPYKSEIGDDKADCKSDEMWDEMTRKCTSCAGALTACNQVNSAGGLTVGGFWLRCLGGLLLTCPLVAALG